MVLYNSPPSVTQKQYHQALSNGLRCCSSCLELTASQPLARGPLQSLPQNTLQAQACRSRVRLLEEIQAAQML